LLYTLHLAECLHTNGYAIEYWTQQDSRKHLPDFVKFEDIGGNRELCRLLMRLMAQGSTDAEALDYCVAHFAEELTNKWPEHCEELAVVWGIPQRIHALKRRCQQPDVVLYVNDKAHGFSSIADSVRSMNVPVLDLQPSMHMEFRKDAGMLDKWFAVFAQWPPHLYVPPLEEPEWKPVRPSDVEVPQEHCAIVYKPLVAHLSLPEFQDGSKKIIGPVYAMGNGQHIERQALVLKETGIQGWLEKDDLPVIYISMGSWVRDDAFLPGAMKRILDAFSGDGSSYRVLASTDSSSGDGFGEHMRCESWAPQFAVLSHPNVKVFVTHGGVNSIHEGIYHGKPLVVLPFFDDQRYIGPRLKELGLASACLSPLTITEAEAAQSVRDALQLGFQDRALKASAEARALRGLEELVGAAMNLIRWAEDHPPVDLA
jgi:hypothetical protein